MAEPFKNLIGPAGVRRLADAVAAVLPIDVEGFVADAVRGLDALELKARVAQVAACLRPRLPAPWEQAVEVMVAALPPQDASLLGHSWLWPMLHVVEVWGAEAPTVSLPALREMTSRFSAEFAIRPLIARHPGAAYETLTRWSADPDAHVRRLVSEGSRPRLPWGMQLRDAVRDPTRGLALLERLVDDPSAYVRRSVANHLGDVAKDHPERAVSVATRWLANRPDRLPLVRHALRHPLKAGHPSALALFGNTRLPVAVSRLMVTPAVATIGEAVAVTAELRGEGKVRVDVVWQWPSARGGWSGKTFTGAERTLTGKQPWAFQHRLSLLPVTTRPLRPGPHRLWLRVCGLDVGPAEFVLRGEGTPVDR
ncbi:MAG: DNA alkylation repair protein [Myxococcales bacterium]|nr:DNA alkylation repair protein [Myxococcales bacterium]